MLPRTCADVPVKVGRATVAVDAQAARVSRRRSCRPRRRPSSLRTHTRRRGLPRLRCVPTDRRSRSASPTAAANAARRHLLDQRLHAPHAETARTHLREEVAEALVAEILLGGSVRCDRRVASNSARAGVVSTPSRCASNGEITMPSSSSDRRHRHRSGPIRTDVCVMRAARGECRAASVVENRTYRRHVRQMRAAEERIVQQH